MDIITGIKIDFFFKEEKLKSIIICKNFVKKLGQRLILIILSSTTNSYLLICLIMLKDIPQKTKYCFMIFCNKNIFLKHNKFL